MDKDGLKSPESSLRVRSDLGRAGGSGEELFEGCSEGATEDDVAGEVGYGHGEAGTEQQRSEPVAEAADESLLEGKGSWKFFIGVSDVPAVRLPQASLRHCYHDKEQRLQSEAIYNSMCANRCRNLAVKRFHF